MFEFWVSNIWTCIILAFSIPHLDLYYFDFFYLAYPPVKLAEFNQLSSLLNLALLTPC